ncbi:Cystathionine beta-lyase MetC [Nymphon striatum]|nr:Cystathionine beta-lyase MetC [Nymphon striatum]
MHRRRRTRLMRNMKGRAQGYTYSREGHPNAEVLAGRIDAMEGTTGGIVTSSGMAAVTAALMGVLSAGDHVIGGDQLYGRSLRLMKEDLPRLGYFNAAITPATKMVLIEVVSNPTLRVADVTGIAALCKARGVLLVVDNTFTTPRAIRPFEHGADIVLHSVTKLMAGHSDVMLGWVAAKDETLRKKMYDFVVTTGMTPSPFDCWLAERGMMSFDLRFDRAQQTARVLADHLGAQKGVTKVLYPTNASHPDHNRATALLGDQGCNMVSFEIPGGRASTNAFTQAAQGIAFAPTLGDVGTTLSHPASSSHRALTVEERAEIGISEGFFRVSVGLEDPDALCDVFDQGLAAAADAS